MQAMMRPALTPVCQESCQCASSVDACVASCLETGAIHADCSSSSRSTPIYYYLVPALGGVALCVVLMFLLWRRFRSKTASLSQSLIEKEQQGALLQPVIINCRNFVQ